MGTHLVRSYRGQWMSTACGKMVQRRAIALAKRGSVAYINVHDTANLATWILSAVKDICPKCLAASSGIDMLSTAIMNRLKSVREIHVEENSTETSVEMCCTKAWAIESLFLNDVGFITAKQAVKYLANPETNNHKLCKRCLEHPSVQLEMLAAVEL